MHIAQRSSPAALHADLSPAERAIAGSVLFAALFDYPLTLAQLRQTLISCELTASEVMATWRRSTALRDSVQYESGFFFPAGRADLIAERRRREARSRLFLDRHRWFLRTVCALPYVRMVALSGSIAHMNLEGTGDLDLFIVTREGRVWSTTVVVVVLAKLLRCRHTVCANFVVAETRLACDDRDLFSASQIVHLKPLTGAETYRQMLLANPFVVEHYPNFHPSSNRTLLRHQSRTAATTKRILEPLLALPSRLVEWGCRRSYGAYLRRRAKTWQSPEQVRLERDCLKLHTQSHRRSVLQRFHEATSVLSAR